MRRFFSWMLILAMLLCGTAATAWGENSSELYEKALGLLRENRFADAGKAFAALGSYGDSPRYVMYCAAIAAGESGQYSTAVENLESLAGFLDSSLLATYYTGLACEAAGNYELAAEVLGGISLYRDAAARMAGYPALMNLRDYRKAAASEQAGMLETALSGFRALGAYSDSAERAEAVQEKIHARDYAAADSAEQQDRLEEALAGFRALGAYSDSAERAEAVQTKIGERDAAAAEQARADAYAAADRAEQQGDYAAAYAGFAGLGDYGDSAQRAAAVQDRGKYAQALQYAMQGQFSKAYSLFTELGEYEDSAEKAYALGVTTFAKVSDRGDGVAAFSFHGLWGLINVGTNTTVSPYWDEIGSFNEFGLARVKKDDLYGFINTSGELVIPCDLHWIGSFNHFGLAPVMQGRHEGYINTAGEYVIPCTWALISAFSDEGFCAVAVYDGNQPTCGLYDKTGREITPAVWRRLGSVTPTIYSLDTPEFRDGKMIVKNKEGLYGFIDTEGNPVGEVRWSSIEDYSEGLAVVVEDGRFGYIDRDGNVVVEPQYEAARSFSEGLAAVEKDGLWQFIDRDGRAVIPPRYSEVSNFSNGRADVYLPGVGWQIIDSAGSLVYFVSQQTADAYAAAKALMEAGSYGEAQAAFSALAGYRDADERALEAGYQNAAALLEAGEYAKASEAFGALSGYRDADERAARAWEQIRDYVVVEDVPGAVYGFALNSDGWYESLNKGRNSSCAICAIRFVTTTGKFSFSVVNSGERGSDYGIISNLDKPLSTSRSADRSFYKSYSIGNTSGVDTITFDVPDVNEHVIYIKFIKDSYGTYGSDSIRFRFD